ncbi:MAG: site-specific DNA-methyltransferase [Coprothermobacterota bacterium]|nr:site-specific DNA-methyltransferase [Coprothermobacterota bacterium]
MQENTLYYGDNLDVMRRHIKDETVDLVYLDPPFNSNANYNVLFAEKDGSKAASQIQAFTDTWKWDQEDEAVYAELVTRGGKVSKVMQAFYVFLGPCDMLSYLTMMAPRLVELRRVMKPTASIYLHCDPTASHYLKMLMDAIFGPGNFRNEVVWSYRRYTAKSNRFQRLHDVILFYGRSDSIIFNDIRGEYGEKSGKADSHYKQDEEGRWFRWQKRKGQEPYKIFLSPEGRRLGDVWDIPHINASALERLGYPTQKPQALLERIISASSNPGDLVFDPFGGCGTTITAAQGLGRPWIGIDITHLAITLIKARLMDSFGNAVAFKTIGEPTSFHDAEALAASDPYQFQWWALGLVGARPVEEKKGSDKGIDGRIIFQGDKPEVFESVILSVKAGHTNAAHVRDLKGVLDREKAAIGVLISMQEPTAPMRMEAITAGFYESEVWGRKYPKMQLVTVAELLAGKGIDMPPIKQVNRTFKRAIKAESKKGEAESLPLD